MTLITPTIPIFVICGENSFWWGLGIGAIIGIVFWILITRVILVD